MLEMNQRKQPVTDPGALKIFFQECNEREQGSESDWKGHKRLILEGFRPVRIAVSLRNGDEITSSTMHHSFRPPLPDLKSQKHQNSLLFHQLL